MEQSPEEKALAAQINFEEDVLIAVKQVTKGHLELLVGAEDNPSTAPANGLVAVMDKERTLDEKKIDRALALLKPQLQPRGYLVFLADRNYGFSPDRLGILKTRDQFDLLEFVQTQDHNSELGHEGVVARLRQWDEKYGIEIFGAEADSADINFKSLPGDMLLFAKEVYEFCPDIMEGYDEAVHQQLRANDPELYRQQYEEAEEMDEELSARDGLLALQTLAQDIQQTQSVHLWWD